MRGYKAYRFFDLINSWEIFDVNILIDQASAQCFLKEQLKISRFKKEKMAERGLIFDVIFYFYLKNSEETVCL